jgi:hypothetical protein
VPHALFRQREDRPLRLKESFDAPNDADTKYPSRPDILKVMVAKFSSIIEQTMFIRGYNGISQQHGVAWGAK